MKLTRRDLLNSGAGFCAASALRLPEVVNAAPTKPRIRIGVSTYSYWHFDKVKYPIEKVDAGGKEAPLAGYTDDDAFKWYSEKPLQFEERSRNTRNRSGLFACFVYFAIPSS
jgi:hypothetical protein